jgi:hypothetical protein
MLFNCTGVAAISVTLTGTESNLYTVRYGGEIIQYHRDLNISSPIGFNPSSSDGGFAGKWDNPNSQLLYWFDTIWVTIQRK